MYSIPADNIFGMDPLNFDTSASLIFREGETHEYSAPSGLFTYYTNIQAGTFTVFACSTHSDFSDVIPNPYYGGNSPAAYTYDEKTVYYYTTSGAGYWTGRAGQPMNSRTIPDLSSVWGPYAWLMAYGEYKYSKEIPVPVLWNSKYKTEAYNTTTNIKLA